MVVYKSTLLCLVQVQSREFAFGCLEQCEQSFVSHCEIQLMLFKSITIIFPEHNFVDCSIEIDAGI